MKIYFIPGLGFDSRIFQNLKLVGIDVEYIDWIDPISSNENISDYAARLSINIKPQSEGTVLIGHSLGGVLSQEIAQIKKIDKIILISSIKSRKELPFHLKIVAPLRLHHLFIKKICIKTVKYWGKKHGYESNSEQDLFKSMVAKNTNKYLQWALKTLSKWQSPNLPKETTIFQIHGSDDKMFPLKLIDKPNVVIENGSHVMLLKPYREINEIILEEIKRKNL
jgi:pimeloyl-ACP methyl ester carboxylesterase